MPLSELEVLDLVKSDLMPVWKAERATLDRIDRWMRWDHDLPHAPRSATREHKELASRAQTPWGDFIVSCLARGLYIEGYRSNDEEDNSPTWKIWQANGFDARQVALNRAVIAYGSAYGLALPGTLALTGEPMPKLRGISPREMIALYEDPADDEWPYAAMRITHIKRKPELRIYDDQLVHTIDCPAGIDGGKFVYRGGVEHGAGVCPVVRFTDRLDLEGRVSGQIEPNISVLARLDQTTYDRLVVQRFSSWVVRTVSGMAEPAKPEEKAAALLVLKSGDLLVSDSTDTKFGSLPATPLGGFIEAHDADVRVLSAVTASPAHEMLGQMANLSAEALAAARAPQTAKADESQHILGEEYERFLRLGAHLAGDPVAAADFSSQVRWKNTEIRSLAQAADALGKLATMLQVPVEILWEKIPGFTDTDVERAKALIEQTGGLNDILRKLAEDQAPAAGPPAPAPPVAA